MTGAGSFDLGWLGVQDGPTTCFTVPHAEWGGPSLTGRSLNMTPDWIEGLGRDRSVFKIHVACVIEYKLFVSLIKHIHRPTAAAESTMSPQSGIRSTSFRLFVRLLYQCPSWRVVRKMWAYSIKWGKYFYMKFIRAEAKFSSFRFSNVIFDLKRRIFLLSSPIL